MSRIKHPKCFMAILFVFTFVMILSGCNNKKKPLVVEPGVGIGEVKFGMTSQEAKKILGEPESDLGEKIIYSQLGLSITLSRGVVTLINCGGVGFDDSIKACNIQTTKGVGIYSSEENIIAVYGAPTKKTRMVLQDYVRFEYTELGATFLVHDSGGVHQMIFEAL